MFSKTVYYCLVLQQIQIMIKFLVQEYLMFECLNGVIKPF